MEKQINYYLSLYIGRKQIDDQNTIQTVLTTISKMKLKIRSNAADVIEIYNKIL